MTKLGLYLVWPRVLVILIGGIVCAGADASDKMEQRYVGVGPIGSLSLPATWTKSNERTLPPGSRLRFGPGSNSQYGIFIFDPVLSRAKPESMLSWFVAKRGIGGPVTLSPDEIKMLSDEFGNAGDNQYVNANRSPDPRSPAFLVTNAQAIPINGRTAIRIDGTFVTNTGKTTNFYVGLYVPSDSTVSRMVSIYAESENPTDFAALQNIFDAAVRSIVWKN